MPEPWPAVPTRKEEAGARESALPDAACEGRGQWMGLLEMKLMHYQNLVKNFPSQSFLTQPPGSPPLVKFNVAVQSRACTATFLQTTEMALFHVAPPYKCPMKILVKLRSEKLAW
jgi:hypothetical protein